MADTERTTRDMIQAAAKAEFLEKGFQGASLRQIVKNAGVTTGAFYGYFSSKEALFASIVEPHAAAVMGRFMTAQVHFSNLPKEQQPEHMGKESADCIDWVIDYIYDHYEEVKLLLCCSSGTSYENFVHNMVEVEVEYTFRYLDVLNELGNDVPPIDRDLCHMIASGMLDGIFEVLRHDMPKERAKAFIGQLRRFHMAGWMELMGQ